MFTQFSEGKENGGLATTKETSILGLQARLPEFISEDPEFWLAQVKAQFKLAIMINQLAKFTLLVDQLPRSMASGLRKIVCNPPPDRPYDTLRDTILGRYGMSEKYRLKQLLDDLFLEDNGLDTPTKLRSYI
ncbi:unnamed protein product [Echinostoma caproni]|uniref:DUF7041 domain-containing protein n=1 Tax=Echinostoma caproni TaxID=27848 RepID=A0A183BDE6_9TREM|nr:unnamed protein product [Echinostoma caproni]